MLMPAREIELNLPHLRLAARAWGDPTLPPLLALHGWLDNAASFDALAPLLSTNFQIVALDFPGHGRSDWRPPGTWYHFIDYLDDVLAAADALGWPCFSLLGHSLGGAIASTLAAVCPERIVRLLLIEALGPITLEADATLPHLQRAIGERAAAAGKTSRLFANLDEAIGARMRASDLSYTAAAALVARGTRPAPGGLTWSSDPRLTLTSPLRYTQLQILNVLAGIRAPTVLVFAQPEQPYLSRAVMQQRIDAVADIRVRRLPGSHHLHLEDATAVAAELVALRTSAER